MFTGAAAAADPFSLDEAGVPEMPEAIAAVESGSPLPLEIPEDENCAWAVDAAVVPLLPVGAHESKMGDVAR